ncbi:MAG: hypothetical protein K6C08_14185 [Oscillospiraceae bacterium]|nr:hypothetical protein [Oscillospiraceae bacterium]
MEYPGRGESVQTVCRKHGIRSTRSFRNWLKL